MYVYFKLVMKGNSKYTAKIIRVPALLNDTKVFLTHWDPQLTIDQNFKRAARENILGKRTRSYTNQILRALRERFIFGDERDIALRKLVNSYLSPNIVDMILYYYTALADPLLYNFVTEFLFKLYRQGTKIISTREAENYIIQLSQQGYTTKKWTEKVCNRVAQNILTSLRDFHILNGAAKKHIAPIYMPLETFVYVAFNIYQKVSSGEKILQHEDWKLYLLDAFSVERLFIEAQQAKFLDYQAAGNLIRITFKQQSYVELADAIIARATQGA